MAFLTALVARLGLGRGCAIPRLKGKEPSATHLFDYLFDISENLRHDLHHRLECD